MWIIIHTNCTAVIISSLQDDQITVSIAAMTNRKFQVHPQPQTSQLATPHPTGGKGSIMPLSLGYLLF